MTQGQRMTRELEYLAGEMCEALQDDCSDTQSYCTIVHTLGRLFALIRELHAMFDIVPIEAQGGK